MKRAFLAIGAAALVMASAIGAQGTQAQSLTKVRLQLKWVTQAQFAVTMRQ